MIKKLPSCRVVTLHIFFLFFFLHSQGQLVISGIVRDEKSEPVSGATVNEKGTSNSTSSNETGAFRLNVHNAKSVLVFSAVGYGSKEIAVGQQSNINIVITSSNKELDAVVVVGYGTQKKISNTGAQSSMTGTMLVQSPAANIS